MPKITFIEHNGKQHDVHEQVGRSLMQAAVDHLVPGIVADCGGSCSCATCHGYIDPDWVSPVPAATVRGQVRIVRGDCSVNRESRYFGQVSSRATIR